MAQLQKVDQPDDAKKALAIKLEADRKKDREMVRGVFRFNEVPGGRMEFMFRKYKKDPLEKFSLVDGVVYTIPLGVATHLNTNVWYPSYSYRSDEAGRPSVTISEKIRRVHFQSLEFMDVDGINAPSTALPQ